MRELLGVNAREHLAIYALATLTNLFLSIPQYLAVNAALELAVNPKGTTASLIAQYGLTNGLVLDFLRSGLIFQGVIAVLVIGLAGAAWSRRGWRWQYALTGVFVSTYLAYHLGGKFLNTLGWIGVLETSGVNVSDVYGDLFWFGLGTTICYLLVILVLRRSYGKLKEERITLTVSGYDSQQENCLLLLNVADFSPGCPKLCTGPPSHHSKCGRQSNRTTNEEQPEIGRQSRSV